MEAGRFDDLLRLWQDGDASPAELEELGAALRENPERRRELVRSVLVDVNLYGRYAVAGSRASSATRSRRWELVAAVLVLALSAVLVGRLLLMKEDPRPAGTIATPPKPAPALPRDPRVARIHRLLDRATVALPQALDAALGAGPGVPVKAELDEEEGTLAWTIHLSLDRKTREVEVDAVSGAILEAQVEDDDASSVAAALKISLRKAIETALAAVPGRALEAEAEFERARIVVEVKILHEEGIREVVVDGTTGELLRK